MSISIFPGIHPEEALSSYVERIRQLHPRLNKRDIVAETFLHPWRDPSALLPRHLDHFSRYIGANIGSSSPRYWLWSHTHFPMFEAFRPCELAARLARRVISGGPGPANQTGERDLCKLRFVKVCPICARDDMAQHGYCWVRRAHLSPYSGYCLQHEEPLIETTDFAPEWTALGTNAAKLQDRQFAIDEVTQSLLQRADNAQGFENLNAWVKSHLAYRGYLTRTGRNRVSRLVDDLRAFYSEGTLCNDNLKACLSESSLGRRLCDVFAGRRKWHSGVGLLLCGYLLRSTPVNVQLSLPFENAPRQPIDEPAVLTAIREGDSLRSIAAAHDVSVTTLSVLARARGWPVSFRPKTVSECLRSDVIRALRNAEAPAAIARRLEVSVPTVYRIRRAAAPEICLMKAKQFEALNNARRAQWLDWCRSAPDTLHSLRELHPGPWMWLYRHDRDWLRANTRVPSVQRSSERHPVNWEARQAVLLPIAASAIRFVQNEDGHPRVTVTSICQRAGIGELSMSALTKMPQLRRLLEDALETNQTYVLRRLTEAALIISSQGAPLSWSRLIREARLRTSTVSKAGIDATSFICHTSME